VGCGGDKCTYYFTANFEDDTGDIGLKKADNNNNNNNNNNDNNNNSSNNSSNNSKINIMQLRNIGYAYVRMKAVYDTS